MDTIEVYRIVSVNVDLGEGYRGGSLPETYNDLEIREIQGGKSLETTERLISRAQISSGQVLFCENVDGRL